MHGDASAVQCCSGDARRRYADHTSGLLTISKRFPVNGKSRRLPVSYGHVAFDLTVSDGMMNDN